MKRKVDREYETLELINRFRIVRVKDVCELLDYGSEKNTRKKMKELENSAFIEKKKWNGENAYWLTRKGMNEIEKNGKVYNWSMSSEHDLDCIRVVSYLVKKEKCDWREIITDRELKKINKLGEKGIHRPDLILNDVAYEIERNQKTKYRLTQALQDNKKYSKQVWIIPERKTGLRSLIMRCSEEIGADVEILTLESIGNYVVTGEEQIEEKVDFTQIFDAIEETKEIDEFADLRDF